MSIVTNRWMDQCHLVVGTEVSLGLGDIVSDGDPAPQKGTQPPIFGPYLLWPNGCRLPLGTEVGLVPGDVVL